MKYFSPSYWFKLWLLSAPLFNDETIGINAKSIDNKKIKDWANNNTNLQSINQDISFTNSSTNYQPYILNHLNQSNKNIDPFYQTEVETNTHKHRHEKSRQKREKRYKRSHLIVGNLNLIEYKLEDSGYNLDIPIITDKDSKREYYYNRFCITEILGYKTWNEFIPNYEYAYFDREILINFYRNDGKSNKYEKMVKPDPIKLSEISVKNFNVENIKSNGGSVMQFQSTDIKVTPRVENNPFDCFLPFCYSQKIFDESINFRLTSINVQIHISLQAYIKNENLMLQEIFRISPNSRFSTAGITVKLERINSLVLQGGELLRKKREILDINNFEEKNELKNLTKWNDEFTKSINHEQHLPIDNKTNSIKNITTTL